MSLCNIFISSYLIGDVSLFTVILCSKDTKSFKFEIIVYFMNIAFTNFFDHINII